MLEMDSVPEGTPVPTVILSTADGCVGALSLSNGQHIGEDTCSVHCMLGPF